MADAFTSYSQRPASGWVSLPLWAAGPSQIVAKASAHVADIDGAGRVPSHHPKGVKAGSTDEDKESISSRMALSACSGRPPDCSDPGTLGSVRRILIQQSQLGNVLEGKTDSELAAIFSFSEMRSTAYDENIKKLSCVTKMTVPIGADGKYVQNFRIQYDSQVGDSGNIAVLQNFYEGDVIILNRLVVAHLEAQDEHKQHSATAPEEAATAPDLSPTAPATPPEAQNGNARPDDYAPAEESQVREAKPAPVAEAPLTISPSFDCAKAGSAAEHLICSDAGLAALDAELSQKYRAARSTSPNPSQLKEDQLTWVKSVRDTSADLGSMSEAYKARIVLLSH